MNAVIDPDWAWARPGQVPPPGNWDGLLQVSGRGWGNTMLASKWIISQARKGFRTALVGPCMPAVVDDSVRGVSGILTVSPDDFRPRYFSSRSQLEWPNGSVTRLFSANRPDLVRGWNLEKVAACDLHRWHRNPDGDCEAWDNLMMALRSPHSQVLATCVAPAPPAEPELGEHVSADHYRVFGRGIVYLIPYPQQHEHLARWVDRTIKIDGKLCKVIGAMETSCGNVSVLVRAADPFRELLTDLRQNAGWIYRNGLTEENSANFTETFRRLLSQLPDHVRGKWEP